MATILLNVKLNDADLKTQLDNIKKQMEGTFNTTVRGGGNGGGGIKSSVGAVDTLRKSYANLLAQLNTLKQQYPSKVFDDNERNLRRNYEQVKELSKAYKENGTLNQRQQKILTQTQKEYKRLSANIAGTKESTEKLAKINPFSKTMGDSIANVTKQYASLLNSVKGIEKYYAKGTFKTYKASLQDGITTLNQLNQSFQTNGSLNEQETKQLNDLVRGFSQLSAGISQARAENTNYHGSIIDLVKGFAKFQLAAMLIMKPLQMVRNAWKSLNETLVETENAVIALQRVAGNAANANDLYQLAQRYGQTFENVNDIALNFARAGYSWNDTIEATEAALLALNVAELDATQSSDGMIAIMKQFGYEASELESIIDKLNITSDNAAVTTEKLLTALQRTGSSAKNAKLSLEETVGIITALSEATGRSGENIGTAVNSLIQFATKESSLDTFAKLGGSVKTAVDDYRMGAGTILDIWRELSGVVKSSNSGTESILGGLFADEDWRTLNEELQADLGDNFATVTEIYDTASTFRKNYFIALLNNLDQVEDTLNTMQESQGYSQRENEQYLDTYTARLNELKAKWKEMANDQQGLLGVKKSLVELGTLLLKILDYAGGFRTVLIGISLASVAAFGPAVVASIAKVVTALKAASVAGATFQKTMGWVALAATALSVIIGVIDSVSASKQIDPSVVANGISNLDKLQQDIDKISSEYQATAERIKSLREQLDSNTLTEEQAAAVKNELLNIQTQLVESNNAYADSLDLINGKLETQLGLTNQQAVSEQRAAIAKFVKENSPSEQAAKKYLYEGQPVIFDEKSNKLYTGEDPLLWEFLYKNGYSPEYTYKTDSFKEAFWEAVHTIFGEKNEYTSIGAYTYEPEYIVNTLLPRLLEEIESSNYNNEQKLYLRSQVQALLNSFTEEGSQYSDALKFIYGDKNSNNFVEWLSNDQRNWIANGEMDDTVFLKLWNEFNNRNSGGSTSGSGGKPSYDSIIKNLEAIRENTDKTRDIEEKMLALEEAKNQRTVRVFNAKTGQWERVANENDIATAQQDLQDSAMDIVLNALQDGKLPSGFEIPDWLANLQSPTSDETFKAFTYAMGILAGVYDKTPSSGGVVSSANTSNTTNNNQSYSLNGVTIPNELAEKYNLSDLYNAMGLQPD